MKRRNFLKLSGAGIAGSVLITNTSATNVVKASMLKPQKLVYRKLGKTGLKIPLISLPVERIDNEQLLKDAIEAGINHFDTANSYQQGKSEEFLGRMLKPYKRKSLIVATKINTKDKDNPEKDLLEKFEISLKRLQMDYVDILYLHAVEKREQVLDEKVIKVFQDLKKQGKAKHIGVSTHRNMAEVINAAVESKVWEVVLTSYNFKLADSEEVTKAIDGAGKAGIGIVAMKTIAGGFWDKAKTKKINATAAIKWALQNQSVTTCTPAITNFDMLQEDLKLMSDLTLTEQEKQDLKGDGSTVGLFCLGCEQCVPQCPNNVPIPDVMRAYMYAYGYTNTRLAREVVDNFREEQLACTACPVCNVECQQGFDIRTKARDILRIKEVEKDFLV
jgi:predicted aldo/keto reductase-like oxidoreductase